MTGRHANVVKEMLSMKCNTVFYDNFVLVSGSYAYNHRITALAYTMISPKGLQRNETIIKGVISM